MLALKSHLVPVPDDHYMPPYDMACASGYFGLPPYGFYVNAVAEELCTQRDLGMHLLKKLFICLFLAALVFVATGFLRCSEPGHSCIVECGISLQWLLSWQSTGSSGARTAVVVTLA